MGAWIVAEKLDSTNVLSSMGDLSLPLSGAI
jgi:hypothetical protein